MHATACKAVHKMTSDGNAIFCVFSLIEPVFVSGFELTTIGLRINIATQHQPALLGK